MLAQPSHMASLAPRCVNCQNFNGRKGSNSICKVWRVLYCARCFNCILPSQSMEYLYNRLF